MTFPFDKSGVLKTISKTLTKHLSERCFPFFEFPFLHGHAQYYQVTRRKSITKKKVF